MSLSFIASIDTTIVEDPNSLDAFLINSGFLIAAVFKHTLSAPALKIFFMSLRDLIPPPTVIGIKLFLAVSDIPVPWKILAKASNFNGKPPKNLIERGLMLELEEGMWLHEALRSRLLREVGTPLDDRAKKLGLN